MKYMSRSEKETKEIADTFVKNILESKRPSDKAVVVALYGDLGSGKTTFTKAAALTLGISDTVTSPTFVIEKTYKIAPEIEKRSGFSYFIHIDAYRLENGRELEALGWKELTSTPKNLIFIEWPEKAEGAVQDDAKKISFKFIDETTREIVF